jgi:hypothetical protein
MNTNNELFPHALIERLKRENEKLNKKNNILMRQNKDLLSIYYALSLMLGEVEACGDVGMHSESKWYNRLWTETNEFDHDYRIFKMIEKERGEK